MPEVRHAPDARVSTSPWGAIRAPLVVGVVSTVVLLVFEWVVVRLRGDELFGGYRFQAWSSEEFMQEVRINDLLEVGPIGLWYLHVQPPMLETLRFLLAFPEYLAGSQISAQAIDQRMYALYAVFFGVLLGVVYAWVRSMTGSSRWALLAAIAMGAYPGTVAMATLLDGTFPSAVLTTIMLYLLYIALRRRSTRWLNWWLASLLLLSWTRTIFQLQILILIPVVVWLIYRFRMAHVTKGAALLSAVFVGALFLLPLKQFLLYDTWATTSFAGNHQIEVVSYRPTDAELAAVEVPEDIIENARNFDSGFNSPENVELNYVLSQVGTDYYLRDPIQVAKNLIWGMSMNVTQAFRFTHDYSILGDGPANFAADSLPWTPPPSFVLSTAFYALILVATVVLLVYAFGFRGILSRARWYAAFLFILATALITFLLANRYDWTEADRLKFVVVPFFLVLFMSSCSWALRTYRTRRSPAVELDSEVS